MKRIYYFFIMSLLGFSLNAQNITAMEYFFDQDPGFNNATAVSGYTSQPNIVNYNFSIPNNLANGMHFVGYRSKDGLNIWSHTNFKPFYVIANEVISNVTQLEYFWDTDAGFNNNIIYNITNPSTDLLSHVFQTSVPNFALGTSHTLFVRAKDANGKFSHTNYLSEITTVPLSINEAEKIGITLYPNPVIDFLTVKTINNEPFRFVLYDSLGKLIIDKVITEDQQIDMSNLESSLYFAHIWKSDTNQIKIVKIIKN